MESEDGATALLLASQEGYLDIVKVLLSAGAYTTSRLASTRHPFISLLREGIGRW